LSYLAINKTAYVGVRLDFYSHIWGFRLA
jgi:hypothetical protein